MSVNLQILLSDSSLLMFRSYEMRGTSPCRNVKGKFACDN